MSSRRRSGRDAGSIDYVILRENTEGLYAARGGGNLLHDQIATDTMVITRKGTERIVRQAFELSRKRNGALKDGIGRLSVTWVVMRDKRDRSRLLLSWTESGVAIQPDQVTRRGYGRELIENALAYALRAKTEYVLGENGVRCRIEMPLTFFVNPDMLENRDAAHIRDITLSYTFFRQDERKSASAGTGAAETTALN